MPQIGNENKVREIAPLIVNWYNKSGRDLPWRQTKDPYAILISEVMLQQTQVDRVIPRFLEFINEFPNFEALSKATTAKVILFWEGLGYNRRAIRLKKLADIVVNENHGELPANPEDMRRLPGIGLYTANAIYCFAYDKPTPLADTNIYRVLSRTIYGLKPSTRAEINVLIEQTMPIKNPSAFYQGIMDIGAIYCKVKAPKCTDCILLKNCKAGFEFSTIPRVSGENSVPYFPKQTRFRGSRRYYRGLIIKKLRALGVDEQIGMEDLKELIVPESSNDNSDSWFSGILEQLSEEGLIDISPGLYSRRVSLPQR